MKRAMVLFLVFSFFMVLASCGESSKSIVDDENSDNIYYADNNNLNDDETADENVDNAVLQDNVTVPDEDTNNVTPDNNVETDEVNTTDEDEVSDIIEDLDEEMMGDSDEEMTDSDTTKPEPPACPEDMFGLTIRVSYSDGTENVDGGGVVNRNPAGTATIDEKTTCYALNTVVALTVVPDANFDFSMWKGKGASKISGEFPNFSITMTEVITVRAEFVAQ